jgi:hypothetical protein
MSRNKKRVSLLAGGLLVLAAALAAVLVMPQVGQAAEMTGPPGPWSGGRGVAGPDDTYLADALSIAPEELAEARQAASAAAIQKAVDEGLLTEEQAESLQNNDRFGSRFGGRMVVPMMRGGFGEIDHEALLAEALNIEVEILREAYVAANEARLAQAVEDGKLTQEQVDMMESGKNLRQYFQDSGVLTDAMQGALKKAVEAGVITQEQADTMLEKMGSGMRGFGNMPRFDRMPGGMRNFGHMPGCEGMRDRGEMPDFEGMWGLRDRGKFGGFGGRLPQNMPMREMAPETTGA